MGGGPSLQQPEVTIRTVHLQGRLSKRSVGGDPLPRRLRPVATVAPGIRMCSAARFGDGYLVVAEDGGVFNFSNKPFHGSRATTRRRGRCSRSPPSTGSR